MLVDSEVGLWIY